MKSRIVRISQVTGQILSNPDKDIFSLAQSIAIHWLERKINQEISPDKHQDHFEYESENKEQAEFLTFEASPGQNVWIMSYSHACGLVETRRWHTEAAIAQNIDGTYFFGLRLNVIDSNLENTAYIPPNTPNLIKDMIEEVDLIVDGKRVLPFAESLHNNNLHGISDIDQFLAHMNDPKRKLPIILISQDRLGDEYIDGDNLARKLAGVAHVSSITNDASWVLTEKVGRNLSAFNKSIRFYPPLSGQPGSAPSLYQPEGPAGRLVDQLSRSAFFFALKGKAQEEEFPTFSAVKNFYFEHIQKKLQESPATNEPPNASQKELIHAQQQRITALMSEVNESFSLAEEEERKRHALEDRVTELLQELDDARVEIETLSAPALSIDHKKSLFPHLSQFGEWAKEHYPEELAITRRATKSVQSSIYAEPDLIYKGVICLAREYRNSVLTTGTNGQNGEAHNLRRKLLQKLGTLNLEDRISIKKEFAGLYGDEYFVTHEGDKHFLDKHLARGGARDPKRCLRIYYTYDSASEKIIVGHLPSHLTNQMS